MSRLLVLLLCLVAAPAWADPCEAIPEAGPIPAGLARAGGFGGTVRYVVDGDGLCVGGSDDPRSWIEVRLADFHAPELAEPGGQAAKAALERLALGRQAECVLSERRRSYDRVIARCSVGGRSLGDLMRAAGVGEGGRGR